MSTIASASPDASRPFGGPGPDQREGQQVHPRRTQTRVAGGVHERVHDLPGRGDEEDAGNPPRVLVLPGELGLLQQVVVEVGVVHGHRQRVLDLVAQGLAEVGGRHPVQDHLTHHHAGVRDPEADLLGAELPGRPQRAQRRGQGLAVDHDPGAHDARGQRHRGEASQGRAASARDELGCPDTGAADVQSDQGACHRVLEW